MTSILTGLKRVILWDYPRAGWQYDVIVALILAFIFFTPRAWFRDQPKASSVVMLPAEKGTNVFWMEPELLSGVSENAQKAKVESLLKSRTGRRQNVVRLEPIFDAEKDVKGYMAFTTP
jgi:hypothetical protein